MLLASARKPWQHLRCPGCRTLLALVGALAAVACASGTSARRDAFELGDAFVVEYREDALSVDRVIRAPVDDVWAALPVVFRDLGYPGGPSVRDEREYLTPYLKIHDLLYQGDRNSVYFNCGGSPTLIADTHAITFMILVRLTPQSEGATLAQILVEGNASDRTQRSKSVHCTGTGRLETGILDRLEARVRP